MTIEATLDKPLGAKTAVILTSSNGQIIEIPVPVPTSKPSNVLISKFEPGDTELEDILKTVMGLGVDVFSLEEQDEYGISYVADEYVLSNNRYIPFRHFGGLGESGYVVPFERFALVGRNAIKDSYDEDGTKFSDYTNQRDRVRFIDFAKKLYDVEEVYLMPSFEWFGHIDLFIGGIPELNLLSVSKDYYKENERIFKEIKKRFHPDIIISDDTEDEMEVFENNYRVVYNKNGELFVVTDKCASGLRAQLKQKGLNAVPTNNDITGLIDGGASIHCVTNVFHSIELLELFNRHVYGESLRIRQYGK